MNELTCGIVIESPAGWLLVHPTNKKHWDIPKGKGDPGENPLDTVLRECYEETGLDLMFKSKNLVDLGVNHYPRKKSPNRHLHLFFLKIDEVLDLPKVQHPASNLTSSGLEVDERVWAPHFEVPQYLSKKLHNHLIQCHYLLMVAPPKKHFYT